MAAPDYIEGQGPIVWFMDQNGNWVEPRNMGWIPDLQVEVDEKRRLKLEAENIDFKLWESEM
jgi:hypothetical protein